MIKFNPDLPFSRDDPTTWPCFDGFVRLSTYHERKDGRYIVVGRKEHFRDSGEVDAKEVDLLEWFFEKPARATFFQKIRRFFTP